MVEFDLQAKWMKGHSIPPSGVRWFTRWPVQSPLLAFLALSHQWPGIISVNGLAYPTLKLERDMRVD